MTRTMRFPAVVFLGFWPVLALELGTGVVVSSRLQPAGPVIAVDDIYRGFGLSLENVGGARHSIKNAATDCLPEGAFFHDYYREAGWFHQLMELSRELSDINEKYGATGYRVTGPDVVQTHKETLGLNLTYVNRFLRFQLGYDYGRKFARKEWRTYVDDTLSSVFRLWLFDKSLHGVKLGAGAQLVLWKHVVCGLNLSYSSLVSSVELSALLKYRFGARKRDDASPAREGTKTDRSPQTTQ